MSRELNELGRENHYAQFEPDLSSEPDVFGPEDIGLVDIPDGTIDMTLPPELIEDVKWPKPRPGKGKKW